MNRIASQMSLAAVAFVVGVVACTTSGNKTPDAGPTTSERVCTVKEDCEEFFDCVGGICQQACGNDDVCAFDKFCNGQGYCQTGCRDSSTCGTDQLCANGVCRNRSEVGTCATKADCTDPPNTKVCIDGACQDPPATCTGPEDCPGSQQCNGFSSTCFDPNGECTTDPDCADKPQCTNGCTCTQDRRCVATPTCTLQDEVTTCGINSYCDTTQSPARCAPVPSCQRQSDCDSARLACNSATRLCERTPDCTASSACTTAPFTHCNTAAGFCQQATCNNGGVTCMSGQVCRSDGTCGPGNAMACTQHTECPSTPVVQYCNGTTGLCTNGCRNDTNCNATIGEKCNGQHVCAIPTGSSSGGGTGGGDGDACMDDAECRAGYLCAPLTGVCREACASACPQCPQTGFGCFAGFCSPAVMPSCP